MKVIVIGAEGDIGHAACAELSARHDVIKVGRSRGDVLADLSDRASLEAMYAQRARSMPLFQRPVPYTSPH